MSNKLISFWKNLEEGQKILVLIGAHLVLGFLVFKIPYFSFFWGVGALLAGLFAIIKTKNKGGYAHFFAAYLVGLEVLFRMTNPQFNLNPFFSQFAKFGVVAFLSLGLIMEKRIRQESSRFVFYFLLLLPALFLTNSGLVGNNSWLQMVSYNLSGPLCLAVAAFYFYKRDFDKKQFLKLLLWMILPMTAMIMFIFLRMPNLNETNFIFESNLATSGGAESAPNQVATILGFGFVAIVLGWTLNRSITGRKYLDWLIALLFLGFGIFTFSRGGPISAIITIFFGLFASLFLFVDKKKRFSIIKISFIVILTFLLVFASLNYVSKGMLEQRYFDFVKNQSRDNLFGANISESGARLSISNLLTGRDLIIGADLQIFKDNLLFGAGVGMSKFLHKDYIGRNMDPHTEFTRLLAEHGLFGLAALILLFYFPFIHFIRNRSPASKIIIIFLISYSFLTMFHSATRLAMVGFIYGLAFINLIKDENQT